MTVCASLPAGVAEGLPFPLWWLQDDSVWEWIRTVGAATLGALIGGFFTLRAQARSAKQQAARELVAREAAAAEVRRADARSDVRALFESLVDLERAISDSERSFAQVIGEEAWSGVWKSIWTQERRRVIRAQVGLVPDAETRGNVTQVIDLLNRARTLSLEGNWPGASDWNLIRLVEALAGEATEIVGAYLRRDPFVSRREGFVSKLLERDEEYGRWQREEWEHDNKIERASRPVDKAVPEDT